MKDVITGCLSDSSVVPKLGIYENAGTNGRPFCMVIVGRATDMKQCNNGELPGTWYLRGRSSGRYHTVYRSLSENAAHMAVLHEQRPWIARNFK